MEHVDGVVLHMRLAHPIGCPTLVQAGGRPTDGLQRQAGLPDATGQDLAIPQPGHLGHRNPGAGAGEQQGGARLHCDDPASRGRGNLGVGWLEDDQPTSGGHRLTFLLHLRLAGEVAGISRLHARHHQDPPVVADGQSGILPHSLTAGKKNPSRLVPPDDDDAVAGGSQRQVAGNLDLRASLRLEAATTGPPARVCNLLPEAGRAGVHSNRCSHC